MKKIMILSNHPDYTYNFRKEIIYKLLEENYCVTLCCPYGEALDPLISAGCDFIEIKFNRHSLNLFKEYKLFKNYWTVMKEYKPDIVLSYTVKPNIYSGIISRFLKVIHMPNITGLGSSVDSSKFLERLILVLYKLSFKNSHTIFFQNTHNYEYLLGNNIKAKYNVILPGSGVNCEDFPYAKYPKNDQITITYFGRIMKNKGIEELLDAILILKKMKIPVTFNFIGFFENEKDLKEKFQSMVNQNDIKYLGYQENVYSYIAESDAVILPSYSEGMSNSLLEAACIGRPLLASDIPGCKEIIEHNKTGYLFEKKSVHAIVEAILKFTKLTYEERQQMGIHSRQLVTENFDRRIVVSKYNEQIKKMGE